LGVWNELTSIPILDITAPFVVLIGHRIDTGEPSFSQPLQAGIPKWMYLSEQQGHVQAIFNDSLARYPLPQVAASDQP